jgi:hypothetical protein
VGARAQGLQEQAGQQQEEQVEQVEARTWAAARREVAVGTALRVAAAGHRWAKGSAQHPQTTTLRGSLLSMVLLRVRAAAATAVVAVAAVAVGS